MVYLPHENMAKFYSFLKCLHCTHRLLTTVGRSLGPANFQCRALATVPSKGPDLSVTGRCSVDNENDTNPRRFVPLSSSIRLANSNTHELLTEFIKFFRSEHHTQVAPSSVYPKRREGSYFINAGMNQFKPLFLAAGGGSTTSAFDSLSRAVNCQPCIRVGGRHDDLNDVGYDGQHHTMFEMLGNWSFGDYYKAEACRLMWKFVCEVLGLPVNALYVTYFGGCPQLGLPADDETRNIWLSLGVRDQKLLPFGVEHNFWRAGHSSGGGLCGPATEIHVDFQALSGEEDLRCARCLINASSPHVVELWNSVFITHRVRPQAGLSNEELLEPLPQHFVDTGMGLERLASVMQGVTSTYDTDQFKLLLDFVHQQCTSSEHSPPEYGGRFLPTMSQLTGSSPSKSPDEVNDAVAAIEVDGAAAKQPGRLATLWRRLGLTGPQGNDYCSIRPSTRSGLPLQSPVNTVPGDVAERDQVLANWHRDTAYRLLVDHARALAIALSDGILPGRQGLGLKLRQLIQRAARACYLSGLETMPRSGAQAVLAGLVDHLAHQHRERVQHRLADESLVCGPNAQTAGVLSPSEIGDVVDREVRSFLPRIDALEDAFHRCLEEPVDENAYRLSDSQVSGLMSGRYGAEVSWDLICAQSQWAGLAPPQPLRPDNPPTRPPGCHGNGTVSSTGGDHASRRNSLLHQLADLLRLGKVAYTDDRRKYSMTRRDPAQVCDLVDPADLYEFPDCQTQIVSVLVPDAKSSMGGTLAYRLISSDKSPVDLLSDLKSLVGSSSRLGLVFTSTNFFTPSGGQDGDFGWIRCPLPDEGCVTLAVEQVDWVPANQSLACGWVVHWVDVPETDSEVWRLAVQLLDTRWRSSSMDKPPTCQLTVDKNRRFNLMCQHTGQHLLTWALSAVAKDFFKATGVDSGEQAPGPTWSDTATVSVQHHGGAVHADSFVLRASLPSPLSDWLQTNLIDFVQRVEAKCRQVIRSQLPVTALSLAWDQVAQNSDVRRFAWTDYGDRVTAVCIGGRLPSADDLDAEVASAELCSGTHLANTGDLQEFTLLSVRSRRQSVKQFTGVAGQAAVEARCRGSQLLLSEQWDSNDTVSLSAKDGPLALVAREQLLTCHEWAAASSQRAERTAGQRGRQIALLNAAISRAATDCRRLVSLPSATVARLSQLELPVASLLDVRPGKTVIMHSGPLALCYFPQSWVSDTTSSALDTAHLLASRLSSSLADRAVPLSVRARPVRASNLDQSNRYRFAALQLVPTSSAGDADWSRLPDGLLETTAVRLLDELSLRSAPTGQ